VITVRVDATQYEGWFYEGAGIYRHAWLKKTNNIHIDRDKYFIHTATKKREGRIELQVQVACTNSGGPIVLYSYVTDRDGRVVASKPEHELTPYPGDTRSFPEVINLTNARPWTLQDPYLYRVVTVIKSGGNVLDSIKTRVGIRTIVINPTDGLFLNDEQIKIKGVCCHQDHAGVGSALPDYLQYYRIRLLKEMGANAYRTSHNAPTPELLDACDSLGMLVLDENRLLNSSPEYKNQYERLLIRDRNHPCVFMWSIGNEEGYVQTNGVGKRIAQSLMQVQKELDPFRTCTYAADVGNVYGGINEIIPVRGFNYRITGIEPYHHDHPGQPVVGTEMGSTVTTRGIYEKDTVRCYLPDEDLTAPWWANKAEEWWPIAASHNWMMGGFVWTGFDYRGEPTPFQWPNINSHFGIMDMCGFPKNIYYYYQSVWTTKPMVHIAQHWNWAGQSGRPTDVWVNSNLPEVELFLNGKSLGRKTKPQYGHLQWSVPFQPGKLEAVATGPGNQTVKTVVETTGAPSKLVLTPDRTALIANGQDATVVNITVLDQEGREVPDAANLIKCTATGSATLIGAGNGDPSSHEPDQYPDGKYQRRLFNGKCQFILRSTNKPGPIHLQFTSDNLPPATLDLKAN
jgi:beta-galactosidase